MNLQTYLLPDFWACSLINADTTNLSQDDERVLDAWFARDGGSYRIAGHLRGAVK